MADRDKNRFMVRMPEGLRDHIADAARANGRSMNSEIVARLQEWDELSNRVLRLESRLKPESLELAMESVLLTLKERGFLVDHLEIDPSKSVKGEQDARS